MLHVTLLNQQSYRLKMLPVTLLNQQSYRLQMLPVTLLNQQSYRLQIMQMAKKEIGKPPTVGSPKNHVLESWAVGRNSSNRDMEEGKRRRK